MRPSSRKLLGTLILLLFLIMYALLAMAVAMIMQVNASRLGELAYYALAGLLWVPPAAWIIIWMYARGSRPPGG